MTYLAQISFHFLCIYILSKFTSIFLQVISKPISKSSSNKKKGLNFSLLHQFKSKHQLEWQFQFLAKLSTNQNCTKGDHKYITDLDKLCSYLSDLRIYSRSNPIEKIESEQGIEKGEKVRLTLGDYTGKKREREKSWGNNKNIAFVEWRKGKSGDIYFVKRKPGMGNLNWRRERREERESRRRDGGVAYFRTWRYAICMTNFEGHHPLIFCTSILSSPLVPKYLNKWFV